MLHAGGLQVERSLCGKDNGPKDRLSQLKSAEDTGVGWGDVGVSPNTERVMKKVADPV